MRYKIKLAVGLYQCVAAVPSVFDVVIPPGLEEYTGLVNLMELPSNFDEFLIATSCFGSYHRFATSLQKRPW